MLLQIIFVALIVILLLAYYIGSNNERYWKKRGVKFDTHSRLLGPFYNVITRKQPLFESIGSIYLRNRNEPAVGVGSLINPTLLVIDGRNVQSVMMTDFNSFKDRGIDVVLDQLTDNLTFMTGDRWKLMRQNISPMFSATKLKNMFYIMNKSSIDFIDYLKKNPDTHTHAFYDTLIKFCNAALTSTIFGINQHSIFDSPFVQITEDFSKPSLVRDIKFMIWLMSPKLAKRLNIKVFDDYEDFFINAITKVTKQRELENTKRHDFIDTCVSLMKNGTMKDPKTGVEIEPTFGILSAQAFFFFIAGVEPCANAIQGTLICLGKHPDILEKVHQEVDEAFKSNEEITYDVIMEMKYFDKVLSEAMRLFPPIGNLMRKCLQDTVLPAGNIKVDKGTQILTSIYQLHRDPRIYPEPEKFDPERFSNERKPSDEHYMPFGRGNRMCIGMRYSKLQILAVLAHVLRHYTVKVIQEGDEIVYKVDFINVRPINAEVQLVPRLVK